MAKCQNTEGHWKCKCLVGYEGLGYNGTCDDIDECLRPGICEANSKCINTDGGNICECDQGYWQWAFSQSCVKVRIFITFRFKFSLLTQFELKLRTFSEL